VRDRLHPRGIENRDPEASAMVALEIGNPALQFRLPVIGDGWHAGQDRYGKQGAEQHSARNHRQFSS
jgi:hypothetical protein